MIKVHSIRIATLAALGVISILAGAISAAPASAGAATAKLEVKVLDAQVQPPASPGDRDSVRYTMEVISVLRSDIRLKTGSTIVVRAPNTGVKPRGWIGVVYLNPDPSAGGTEPGSHFVAAGSGFEDLPPTPPSATWIEYHRKGE